MAILALGVSHRRAPVELLDRLAFADEDYAKAYRRAAEDPALEETVILSTCNRVEAYARVAAYHGGFQALKRLLAESRGLEAGDMAEALYSHYEEEAARHLFGVAAGMDSMVLGEPQILSQVREAHRRAEREGASGHTLTALFHAAARAGRRVRSETSVGAAPDAFVRAGVELADGWLGGLEGTTALVVGAGHMSGLAVKLLRDRGVGTLRVLNRSLERARALAERVDAEHGDLSALPDALGRADLVVSATGSSGVVVHADTLERVRDGGRRLFLLDLAVPRDVEASAAALPEVRLVGIEDLRETLAIAADGAPDLDQARALLADELHRFTLRRRAERLAPLIHALRDRGDAVVNAELARFRSDLEALTPDEREAVAALARGIVAKLLHDPIVRLKDLSAPGTEDAHARLLATLFDPEIPGR